MRLNRCDDLLDGQEYPTTTDDVIDTHGESEIELPNGSATVAEVLGRTDAETYHDAEDLRNALLGNVGHEAVGRRFYSDRDPTRPGENGPDAVSF
jgi:hypothetical protein